MLVAVSTYLVTLFLRVAYGQSPEATTPAASMLRRSWSTVASWLMRTAPELVYSCLSSVSRGCIRRTGLAPIADQPPTTRPQAKQV